LVSDWFNAYFTSFIYELCYSSHLRWPKFGILEIVLSLDAKASLTPLPNYTFEIKRLLAEHNTRIVQNHEFNPNSGYLPLVIKKDLGIQRNLQWYRNKFLDDNNVCTLLQCMTGKVPCNFKVRFIIKRVFPPFDKENSGMIALCVEKKPKINEGRDAENKIYQFAMRIFDSTSEMDIIVPNSAGQQLIGISSKDLFSETNTHKRKSQHQDTIDILSYSIETSIVYIGTIQSFMVDGAKYFVLDSLITLPTNSGVV